MSSIGVRRLAERGIALLAVLMALTLLLLLALPFAVSMSRGADVAARSIELRQAEMLSASARDLMLGEAALGHATYDETPDFDELAEFPSGVPDAFPALRDDGRVRPRSCSMTRLVCPIAGSSGSTTRWCVMAASKATPWPNVTAARCSN